MIFSFLLVLLNPFPPACYYDNNCLSECLDPTTTITVYRNVLILLRQLPSFGVQGFHYDNYYGSELVGEGCGVGKSADPKPVSGPGRRRVIWSLGCWAHVNAFANLYDSLLARGFSLEVIEATWADTERVYRPFLPLCAGDLLRWRHQIHNITESV